MPTDNLPSHLRRLLARVSRSFGLSLAALPRGMRAPAGLGYLMARASDTIADSPAIAPEHRLAALDRFTHAATGSGPVEEILGADAAWRAHPHAGERELLGRIPELFAALEAMPTADASDLREVLREIISGQRLDLERFGSGGGVLPDARALDDYTGRVAGCVGLFWTRLGFRHARDFASLPQAAMEKLGEHYGRGLQLVNILRDFPEDLAVGRCYLPAEELRARNLPAPPTDARSAGPVFFRWWDEAVDGLRDGLRYAASVKPWRLRFASALPALLGMATLREIKARFPEAKIKLRRAETRRWMLRCALARRAGLEELGTRALGGG